MREAVKPIDKGSNEMVTPAADGDFWNYLSTIMAAVVVFLLAWYKDSRTHKRIDGNEAWISKVEEKADKGVKELAIVISEHTTNFIRDYPDKDALKDALKPIMNKLEEISEVINDEKERRYEELVEKNKRLEDELKNK